MLEDVRPQLLDVHLVVMVSGDHDLPDGFGSAILAIADGHMHLAVRAKIERWPAPSEEAGSQRNWFLRVPRQSVHGVRNQEKVKMVGR